MIFPQGAQVCATPRFIDTREDAICGQCRAKTHARYRRMKMADDEAVVETTLPHSSFGGPDCCGCLNGIIRGDQADIVCNECEAVIRTVPVADLRQILDEMELTLDLSSAECPRCGAVNLLPG